MSYKLAVVKATCRVLRSQALVCLSLALEVDTRFVHPLRLFKQVLVREGHACLVMLRCDAGFR